MLTSAPLRVLRSAAVATSLLLLVACGDDDDPTADATTSTSSAADPAPVAVTGLDYRYEGLPAEVSAGTRLTFTNTSTAEVHELVALRLADSEQRTAAELAQLPMDQLMAAAAVPGPPAAVLVAPPSSPGFTAVGDGTLSAPGRYLVFCAIPKGADPAAYLAAAQASQGGPVQVPGGLPHTSEGMYGEVRVTG